MNCPTGRHRGPHTDGTGGRNCEKHGKFCMEHDCRRDGCFDECPCCDGLYHGVSLPRWLYWKLRGRT